MKTLYIIRGIPGSGKSTLAETLCGDAFFEADKFPGIYDESGKYVFEKQKESHEFCREEVRNAMVVGKTPIAVSNTAVQRKYYQDYLWLAREFGYSVQIITCEGVESKHGRASESVHFVPSSVIGRMKKTFEPYVPLSKLSVAEVQRQIGASGKTLRLVDRDGTLIYNPERGIPQAGKMQPIPGMQKIVQQWKEKGDSIVIISNQAGVETGHKTRDDLLEESRQVQLFFPEIDKHIYCPDLAGNQCLVYNHNDQVFYYTDQDICKLSCFRKPFTGMLEYAMFWYSFDSVEVVGNSREDELAAMSMDMPFRHVHDVLYS